MRSHLILVPLLVVLCACASTQLFLPPISNDPGKAVFHLKRESATAGTLVSDMIVDLGDAVVQNGALRLEGGIVAEMVWDPDLSASGSNSVLTASMEDTVGTIQFQAIGWVSSGNIISWERNPGTASLGIIDGGTYKADGGTRYSESYGRKFHIYSDSLNVQAGHTYYVLLGASSMAGPEGRSFTVSESPLFELGSEER